LGRFACSCHLHSTEAQIQLVVLSGFFPVCCQGFVHSLAEIVDVRAIGATASFQDIR
jgi:hypothetical protein